MLKGESTNKLDCSVVINRLSKTNPNSKLKPRENINYKRETTIVINRLSKTDPGNKLKPSETSIIREKQQNNIHRNGLTTR